MARSTGTKGLIEAALNINGHEVTVWMRPSDAAKVQRTVPGAPSGRHEAPAPKAPTSKAPAKPAVKVPPKAEWLQVPEGHFVTDYSAADYVGQVLYGKLDGSKNRSEQPWIAVVKDDGTAYWKYAA